MDDSKKYTILFRGAIALAGIVVTIAVFPFGHIISGDVFEDTIILSSIDGVCVVDASDKVPKTIKDCYLEPGTPVTVRYGDGLSWASIASP